MIGRSWGAVRWAGPALILWTLSAGGCSSDGAGPTGPVGSAVSPLLTVTQEAEVAVGVPSGSFGQTVSLSGDTLLLVGAPGSSTAYVFVRNGTTWTQEATLVGSDTQPTDGFGCSVSLSIDTAVVGSRCGSTTAPGVAYVFVRSGTTWTQQAELSSSDAAPGDYFAHSVGVSGDIAVVGAPGQPPGAAYAFSRTGTTWVQEAKLTDSSSFSTSFGWSVSVSGDTALIGEPHAAFQWGLAVPFVRTGTTWTQQALLVASDPAGPSASNGPGDHFGTAVSISGDTALIGAPDKGLFNGAVYVFVRSGTTWTQQAELSDSTSGDSFGAALSLAGDVAVIDAPGGSVAYAFAGTGSSWVQAGTLPQYGVSVALSSGTAVVGSPGQDGAGAVYVFTGFQRAQGDGCNVGSDCASGLCVDGVCCDTACGGGSPGDCIACSKAAGGIVDGTCGPLLCAALDQCHVPGTCAAGVCDNPVEPDGTPCDGGACTLGATCQAGACTGASPVVCAAIDQCHQAGTCDLATNQCANPALADGTPCDDGDPSTPVDHCETGACLGGPLVPWTWVAVAPMIQARAQHTAIRLPSGKVFVTGGVKGDVCNNDTLVPIPSSEIYDPIKNTWTAAASSAQTHPGSDAVLLPDGRVIVPDLSASEVYDPAADAWTATAPAPITRSGGTRAFRLADGKVAAFSSGSGAGAIYDPTLDAWTTAAPWPGAISAMVQLGDGRIFAQGGSGVVDYAIYDPAADQWTALAPSQAVAAVSPPALLPDGRVLVPNPTASAVYDPATDIWTPAAPTIPGTLGGSYYGEMPALLPGGRLSLLGGLEAAGGYQFNGTLCGSYWYTLLRYTRSQVFDAAALTWHAGSPLHNGRGSGAVTTLDHGEVLLTGGILDGCWDACGLLIKEAVTNLVEIYEQGAPQGTACTLDAGCLSGLCVDGVCCDTACGGGSPGDCEACSKAAGGAADGTCGPVICAAPDPCNAGTCQPGTGTCGAAPQPDGTPCPGGVCHGGTCAAADAGLGAGGGSTSSSGGTTTSSSSASSCAHALCVAGDLLDPACDPCVQEVCASYPSCCESTWGQPCVDAVPWICGGSCPGSTGSSSASSGGGGAGGQAATLGGGGGRAASPEVSSSCSTRTTSPDGGGAAALASILALALSSRRRRARYGECAEPGPRPSGR